MIPASQQQIAAGISMPRTKGSKKATRKFALGGIVRDGNSFSQDLADSTTPAYTPSLGNDLTRANAMGAAADRMAQDRMARSATDQPPVASTQSVSSKPLATGLGRRRRHFPPETRP